MLCAQMCAIFMDRLWEFQKIETIFQRNVLPYT